MSTDNYWLLSFLEACIVSPYTMRGRHQIRDFQVSPITIPLRSVPEVCSFFSNRISNITLSVPFPFSREWKINMGRKQKPSRSIHGAMQSDFNWLHCHIDNNQLWKHMLCCMWYSCLHILSFWKTQLLFLFVCIFITACLCIFR